MPDMAMLFYTCRYAIKMCELTYYMCAFYFLVMGNLYTIFILSLLKSMYLRKIVKKQLILTQDNKEHRWLYSQVTYAYRVILQKIIAKFYTTITVTTAPL